MYFFSVCWWFNELCSFLIYANLMASTFRVTRKIANVASDIGFLEECGKKGHVPNGFRWKFKAQGLKEEDIHKLEQIKKDAVLRVMDVVLKGLKQKEEELRQERGR